MFIDAATVSQYQRDGYVIVPDVFTPQEVRAMLELGELPASPARLAELKRNAKRIAKPQAAYDVARIALGLAGGVR